jgi:hypothetical protein
MNYQELRSLVGGSNPQAASYQDIISGIQSQYTPQTQFAPTRSLLDSIGVTVPDQQRIAYGSLLQAQPRVLPTPMQDIAVKDTSIILDTNALKNIVADSNKVIDIPNLNNTFVPSNDTINKSVVNTDTTNTGLFGTNVTGTDVAKVAGTVAPIAALAGNSDLVKTAIALNLIGSAADIKTEQDVVNLGTRIAMLAAGPYGNVLAAGLGLATNNTPMTANALLSLANPTLGLVNSIVSNLTGNSFGNVVSGLISAPEGSISDLGLLGASNYGNAIDRSAADVNDVLRDAITNGFDLTGSYDFSGGGIGGSYDFSGIGGGGGRSDFWTNRAVNAE